MLVHHRPVLAIFDIQEFSDKVDNLSDNESSQNSNEDGYSAGANIMKFKVRPYHDQSDLFAVATLIRQIYDRSPSYNAWSCFRYDIWAQRRIGDEEVFHRLEWQKDFFLWEDAKARLVGTLFFENENLVVISSPDYPELYEIILLQSEELFTQKGLAKKSLGVEVLAKNNFAQKLLKERGYLQSSTYMIYREKQLENSVLEPVKLPPGYILKTPQSDEELTSFLAAVKIVFNFEDCPQVYRLVQEAPSYVPLLDLLILTKQGEVASFCTAWLDKERRIAEFEPVGTVPAFRQLGLGTALLAETHNRLRDLRCCLATVCSFSEAVAANALYSQAGLNPYDKIYTWYKTFG